MEALIVALFAVVVIVLLDAGYAIALCLMRWTPSLAVGVLVDWLGSRHGADGFQTLALGALATLLARRILRPRVISYDDAVF